MADMYSYGGRRPYDLNRAWVEARSGWADGAGGVRRGGGGGGGGSLCAHAGHQHAAPPAGSAAAGAARAIGELARVSPGEKRASCSDVHMSFSADPIARPIGVMMLMLVALAMGAHLTKQNTAMACIVVGIIFAVSARQARASL